MGATAFNRARRLRAAKVAEKQEPVLTEQEIEAKVKADVQEASGAEETSSPEQAEKPKRKNK